MIEELDTEEMRRDPEINKHLQAPHEFSAGELKPRSMKTVNIPYKGRPFKFRSLDSESLFVLYYLLSASVIISFRIIQV